MALFYQLTPFKETAVESTSESEIHRTKPMKTFLQTSTFLVAAGLITGCAGTGVSTHEKTAIDYANYILALPTSRTTNVTPAIVTPVRLAVAQVGETAPSGEMLHKLRSDSTLVASAVGLPLPSETDPQSARGDVKPPTEDFVARVGNVCSIARTVGADYIFIYGSSLASWQEQNSLMILDATVIGGATIPSTKINCESRAAGALIRAYSAEPVLFVNVESKLSGRSPTYLASGKTDALKVKLRDQVTASLTDELLHKLSHTK